jgi:hypothetical protein
MRASERVSPSRTVKGLAKAHAILLKGGHESEAEACSEAIDILREQLKLADAQKRRAIERLEALGV